jgi:TonB-dependent starch-binding outer membrane protein SusC
MKKSYTLVLMLIFYISTIQAQDIPISGKVTSAVDQTAIPGVTVKVKGTVKGTTTGLNGEYSLNAPSDGTLIFSFVGMEMQEVAVNGHKKINIEMKEEKVDLGEVVVVGYSTDSRKLISGSIGVVHDDEIKNIPLRTIDGVLQGKSAGVNITQNSGTPGGQSSIRIRGGSSITLVNQPLIIMDGVPLISGEYSQASFSGQEINGLSDINPNDIESVTILKDASATAIYGARASNGVILITTKKGSYQKTNVNLNTSYGWQQMPREKMLHLMNAQEWNEYTGSNVQGIDTDWMKEILRIAPTSSTEFSVSSGNSKTRLFLSGNYYNQDGVVLGTSYERYSGRMNVDHKLLDNLTIGGGITLSYTKNARVEGDQTLNGPLPNAMSIPAIYPVTDSTGKYVENGIYANPVCIAKESVNNAYTNRTNGNVYLEYKFLHGFTISSKWGTDIYSLREHSYDPATTLQGARYKGLGVEGTSFVSNLVSNNVIQYSTSIKEKHNIDALLGYSFEKYALRSSYIEGIDFPNEFFQYITSAGTIRLATASALDRGLNSYFGQVKYNYRYKYVVTITARADGSSKFGANNRYGYFPAASFAWRASEEPFIKKISYISELKVRASIGLTGNDAIGDFASLGLYKGSFNYGGNSGIAPTQLPNPDLKWESTLQNGIGFDLGFLHDRIALNADFYLNKTHDLLLDRPIPESSGFTTISSNIGSLENKGVELTLNTRNLEGRFSWVTSLNFAANRNKITELYNDQPLPREGRGGNDVRIGEPIGIFWGLRCLGVDPSTGNLVYDDLNHDNLITADDQTKIGDPNPKFTLGITNSLTYGSFDLSVFLQSVYGNDVFNGTFIFLKNGAGVDNQTTDMLRRWQKPGDVTDIPKYKFGDAEISSRFIEDGSFLRIKNVTLGYNLNKSVLKTLRLKSARVYATAQNLYTFTAYTGMDPEVNYYGGSSNIILGTDFFTFPQVRTYLIGLNIGF